MNWKDLVNSTIKTGLNSLSGGLVDGALGLLGGLFNKQPNQEELQRQAWEYEKEGMALQYQYGQQAADAQQKRNLEMWEATNYSAQREQLEKAGLSVGLMYGQGGAGGATATGGQPTQPSGMSINPVQAKLQAAAIGIQMKQTEAQTRLANAEAMKASAEAGKISGVDTKLGEATIDNLIARTKNEDEKRKLIKQQTRLEMINGDLAEETINLTEENRNMVKTNIKKATRESEQLLQQIKSMKIDNAIKEATMQNVIAQQAITTTQMIKNLTKTTAETEAIYAGINKMVADVVLQAEGNQIKWNELQNDLTKFLGEMGVRDEQIKQGYLGVLAQAMQGIAQLGMAYKLITGRELPKNLKIPKYE